MELSVILGVLQVKTVCSSVTRHQPSAKRPHVISFSYFSRIIEMPSQVKSSQKKLP